MIVIIDNYDSFTYNLYQYIGEQYPFIEVYRNDEITLNELEEKKPEAIVISPGPGYPKDAGISIDVIKYFSGKLPILGVCLGHQSIAEAFGGTIIKATELMHGKSSDIIISTNSALFKNLPNTICTARYHSLIAEEKSLPDCLNIIGRDDKNQIMALEHKTHKTFGVQFHPESILTTTGKIIINNFLSLIPNFKKIEQKSFNIPTSNKPKTKLKEYISKVSDGINLTEDEAFNAVNIIMCDEATDAQISSLLTSLKIKGETIEEITGFAKGMRQNAKQIDGCSDAIDIVGTGGDMSNTFNISTTSSFVISAAGAKVAKHGNRSVSSRSGAADVLESLGVKITSTPEKAKQLIDNVGLSFLFAQSYHSSMKYVANARRETGIRTIFNILGPLSNPASTDYILLGVFNPNLLEPLANVLVNLNIKRAMLVYGNDKLDEISISASTSVVEINGKEIKKYEINPFDFGMSLADKSEIEGGEANENAEITKQILNGTLKGAKRNIVLLNAGCALYVCGKANTIFEGIKLAEETIDSGKAYQKLNEFISATNED